MILNPFFDSSKQHRQAYLAPTLGPTLTENQHGDFPPQIASKHCKYTVANSITRNWSTNSFAAITVMCPVRLGTCPFQNHGIRGHFGFAGFILEQETSERRGLNFVTPCHMSVRTKLMLARYLVSATPASLLGSKPTEARAVLVEVSVALSAKERQLAHIT